MDFKSLNVLLSTTYNEMIPLSSQLTGVAKECGIGCVILHRDAVWASLARAEPLTCILATTFALGLCILFFSPLVWEISMPLSPIVKARNRW